MLLAIVATLVSVTAVHDGDTLTVREREGPPIVLRLAQIDAPERGQPYSRAARVALLELCGQPNRLEFRRVTSDRYGRTVAHVECDGVDANFELVRRGLAWCFPRYVTDDRCYAVESDAKAGKRGLWRDPNPTAPWDHRAAQRSHKRE